MRAATAASRAAGRVLAPPGNHDDFPWWPPRETALTHLQRPQRALQARSVDCVVTVSATGRATCPPGTTLTFRGGHPGIDHALAAMARVVRPRRRDVAPLFGLLLLEVDQVHGVDDEVAAGSASAPNSPSAACRLVGTRQSRWVRQDVSVALKRGQNCQSRCVTLETVPQSYSPLDRCPKGRCEGRFPLVASCPKGRCCLGW